MTIHNGNYALNLFNSNLLNRKLSIEKIHVYKILILGIIFFLYYNLKVKTRGEEHNLFFVLHYLDTILHLSWS